MLCQVCSVLNHDDAEYCRRCQNKLLVVSGGGADADQIDGEGEQSFSFDEHVLERLSILEEVLRRTGETVRSVLQALHKQEENILINHSGLVTMRELLERHGVVSSEEWNDLWSSRLDQQLLALERRDRFTEVKSRVSALYGGDKRDVFERHLVEAEYALFALDVPAALAELEKAFKLDRSNYALAEFLGECRFHEGAVDAALIYFDQVLAAKPDHYEGLVYSGVIRHQRGDNERAERHLKRAVALYPDSFLPHFSLGAILAVRGDLARAATYLEQATQLDSVPHALYLLGSCYYEMGKVQPSIQVLREAIRLDPAFEECFHLLGLCYVERHWNRKALDAFRRAQRLNPRKLRYEDLMAYLSGGGALPPVGATAQEALDRAEGCLRGGSPQKALAVLRRALRDEPDNQTLLMTYALACLQLDRNQETLGAAQKILQLEPTEMMRATAYATLIAALRGEGRYREGNRMGQQLLDEGASDFSRAIAYYEMAYNLAEMDEDLDTALDLARRSLDCCPEELKQFSLAALGWVHYKRREFEEAIDCLSQSTELGRDATTMTHLGMALLAHGQDGHAKQVLDDARVLERGSGDHSLSEKMLEFMKDSARIVRGPSGGSGTSET